MGLISWLAKSAPISWVRERLSLGLADVHGWRDYIGGSLWAGKPVTFDNSMQLSPWWGSVRLYQNVTGAMPLKLYERLDSDDRRQIRDHDIADLIAFAPNADDHPQEFWGSQAAALCTLGNAYAEKRFVGTRIVALQRMPLDTYPFRDRRTDDLQYRFTDRGKVETLPREKVFHTRGLVIGTSDVGLSPLAAARQGLSISLATEEAAGKYFAQGMRASGFFEVPVKMDKKQSQDFQERFIDPIIGNDASAHYGILEVGTKFTPINAVAKDAEMLLSRRFNIEDICRFMGVPPILVGHNVEGQSMWGTGVENIINAWLTLGLDGFLRNIEWSINTRILNPVQRRKYYAEFDRDSLLRNDSAARAAIINSMIQNAQMTPNEGRKKLNRLPVEGGDQALVNSTLVPLTQVGNRVARVQPAPGDPIPEPDPPEPQP